VSALAIIGGSQMLNQTAFCYRDLRWYSATDRCAMLRASAAKYAWTASFTGCHVDHDKPYQSSFAGRLLSRALGSILVSTSIFDPAVPGIDPARSGPGSSVTKTTTWTDACGTDAGLLG
jgi:hypothetical protein